MSSYSAVFTGCLVTASNLVDSSASAFHGSSTCWLGSMSQVGVAWLQSSNKGSPSRPYGSRTVLPNCRPQTVRLCRWPPPQGSGPPFADSDYVEILIYELDCKPRSVKLLLAFASTVIPALSPRDP
jgi:hypothetical protein